MITDQSSGVPREQKGPAAPGGTSEGAAFSANMVKFTLKWSNLRKKWLHFL